MSIHPPYGHRRAVWWVIFEPDISRAEPVSTPNVPKVHFGPESHTAAHSAADIPPQAPIFDIMPEQPLQIR